MERTVHPETAVKLPPLEVAENAGGGICIYEDGEEDYPIARMNGTRDVPKAQVKAEAEQIVRACNDHDALMEVCRLIDDLDLCEGYSLADSELPKLWNALSLARQIRKATNPEV